MNTQKKNEKCNGREQQQAKRILRIKDDIRTEKVSLCEDLGTASERILSLLMLKVSW